MKRLYSSLAFLVVLLLITSTVHCDSFENRPPPKPTELVTTAISVVYTTVTYSPTPTVYNVSNTKPGYQEQPTDPNGQSLQESLQDDQQALRRMIMILSLVGGLGVVAVVATIVIFTRMRARNRKQREMDDRNEEISDEHLIHTSSVNTDNNNNNNNNSHGVMIHSASSLTSLSVNSSDDRQYLEPSAPPALSQELVNRRTLVSMTSQTTAPSPSAPTAKELDAMIDDETSNESSSHTHINTTCSRCAPLLDPPELPPPAYTPSAPPHYVLPPEPIVASRRHSLGT